MFVGIIIIWVNMLVIDVNGELFDIEVMIVFLIVIVGDFFEVFFSNSCLLYGNIDMKVIGCKIRVIIFKILEVILLGDMD